MRIEWDVIWGYHGDSLDQARRGDIGMMGSYRLLVPIMFHQKLLVAMFYNSVGYCNLSRISDSHIVTTMAGIRWLHRHNSGGLNKR